MCLKPLSVIDGYQHLFELKVLLDYFICLPYNQHCPILIMATI